ncbi:hypothetical protein PR202_ga02693 [Eleusine coracana subsp. coracana]|uniref:Uncharacterized protein n=1 Tax=Eleusine coracana subsp. coracana TaxID=191504 RepID=A0AAV5BM92_ELECO|nr:hypothetical protein PR202_ga02693 [Eleusine coracana subsp. coracana]
MASFLCLVPSDQSTGCQPWLQGKQEVEESIEKHKQAVKELIEHCPGISSQVPPFSTLEKNFLAYFRSAKVVEESQFNDGAATQTPGVETATVSVPATASEQMVDTPQRAAKAKLTEERAVSTLPKPSAEVRRPGARRLVRPTLERTEEPQADTDASTVEGSIVGLDKTGPSLQRGISGAVLQPSSRKRLISSSQMIDNTSSGEANEANPPLKRPKEEESSQETNELKNDQPPIGDAVVPPSTDDQEGQQPSEEMDTDQASVAIEETEATREDDIGDKDDTDAHVDASMHIRSQDTDVGIDNNATPVEDALVKSESAVQLYDENQKIDDLKDEAQLTTATDVDDEMEEGELPEEPEQPLEITALEEAQREPSDIGEQAGSVFSVASPGEPTEKNELDMSDIGESDTATERAAVESDQSPIAPTGGADASPSRTTDASPVREPSPNLAQTGASSEQQNTSTVTGGREPSPNQAQAGGSSEQRSTTTAADGAESRSTTTTINLQQRAMLNRQARMRAQQTVRGRGQQSPQRRGAAGRGPRGRGGRGQT